MSLIVQVNSKSGGNGAAAPTPAAAAAAPAPAGGPTPAVLPPKKPQPTSLPTSAATTGLARATQPQPIVPPQPSTITITSIAEQQTQQAAAAAAVAAQQQQQQQHIVQHHPPPLGLGDPRLRMIQVPPLPQSPVRQSALPPRGHSPISRPPLRLPQSPVRQHQLPQVPVGVGSISAAQQQRILAQQQPTPPPAHSGQPQPLPGVGSAADRGRSRQPLLVASGRVPSPAHTLSMLPQSPTPGILPTAPSPDVLPPGAQRGIMPYPPSNLVPQPPPPAPPPSSSSSSSVPSASSKILTPSPSVLHQQLLGSRPHRMPASVTLRAPMHPKSRHRNHSTEELEVTEAGANMRSPSVPGRHPVRYHQQPHHHGGGGRGHHHVRGSHHSSLRGRTGGHGNRNQIWQCVALQDHNYASRPPPTPPPSPGRVAAATAAQHAAAAAQEAAAIAAAQHAAAAAPSSTLLFNPLHPPSSAASSAMSRVPQLPPHANQRQHQQHPPLHPHPGIPPHSSASFNGTFGIAGGLLAAAAIANSNPTTAAAAAAAAATAASQSPLPVAQSPPTSLLPPSMVVSNPSPVPLQPATREEQNSVSIEEAGVGPMTPLVDTARAVGGARGEVKPATDEDEEGDGGERSSNEEGGEETETAPEPEEEEDDSITRCICDFLHDDGYMICCDKCSVWQHVVCMGLDKNNIPDEYLCEVCKPRPIDRKRARALQSRRRTEIFHNSSSSDSESTSNATGGGGGGKIANRKKMVSKKAKGEHPMKVLASKTDKMSKVKGGRAFLASGTLKVKTLKEDKMKKQKKRKPSEKGQDRKSVKKVIRRKSYNDDEDDDVDEEDEDADSDATLLEPRLDDSQQLRSWIDQYEEAVTNHYSPELRARLGGNKLNSIASDLRPSVIGGPVKCNVSLKGNGVKILTASTNVPVNTPIIECKGRLMLTPQFRVQSSPSKSKGGSDKKTPAHVFFYQLTENLEICLDGRTYGNDARFCRRSHNPNAELRHVVDKGSLHLFIVAVKTLEKNNEILLPLEMQGATTSQQQPLPSINADLREINKKPVNGLVNSSSGDEMPKEKKKKKKEKVKKVSSKEKQAKSKAKKQTSGEEDEDSYHSENEVNGEAEVNNPVSPTKTKPSPGKMGLPDNSGLIVGVNTINYDAASSVRNKGKSREERKMEMIMKAIEAMEKAEQRKKEQSEGHHSGDRQGSKRRRSTSTKNNQNTDSALEVSSADEGMMGTKQESLKRSQKSKKGRKSGPSTPQRRRSRVLSGESASAVSETEAGGAAGTNVEAPSSSTPNTANSAGNSNGPFRFPKTKKSLMSDWLQESEGGGMEDDDVSGSYLRGSRSPPGIATHLLRSAPHSPIKSVCSAKKRWLRQAISEDHSEETAVMANGGSPTESSGDYVTPLKKRRLANFTDDVEHQDENESPGIGGSAGAIEATSPGEAASPTSQQPGGLKKKLLHNMVLEAVLDKAMEDMLGGGRAASKDEADDEVGEEMEAKEGYVEERPPLARTVEEEAFSSPVEKDDSVETDAAATSPESAPASSEATAPEIKTPEPSSVFKSYFKSTVSIEELEKQIEATKKERQELNLAAAAIGNPEATGGAFESGGGNDDKPLDQEIKTEEANSLSTDYPEPGEGPPSLKEEVREVESPSAAKSDVKFQIKEDDAKLSESQIIPSQLPVEQRKEEPPQGKPKEKRRVSLADYKRRRKQDGSQQAKGAVSSTDISTKEDGPGTPTLDEQRVTGGAVPTPTLSTLPLFEKLEKLEQQQKANKKKVQTSTSLGDETMPEPKREDLTERLKKEFGLTVDDDSDNAAGAAVSTTDAASAPSTTAGRPLPADDGDSTPELDGGNSEKRTVPQPAKLASVPSLSGPPHPPPSGYSSASTSKQGFVPTQYPSYPSNFPVPPYPKGNLHTRPPGPPHPPPPHSSSSVPPMTNMPAVPHYPPPPFPSSSRSTSSGIPPREYPREDGKRREYYTTSSAASSSSSSHSPGNRSYFEQRGGSRGSDGRDRDLRRDYHRDYHHRERDYHHHRGSSDKSRDSRQRHGERGGSSGYRSYYGSQ